MDELQKHSSEAMHCEFQNDNEPGQTSSYCTPPSPMNMSSATAVGAASHEEGLEESQDSVLRKLGLSDQTINPSSPSFDFQRWSQSLVSLRNRLRLPTPPRSGFAFKSLTVYGSGPAVEQQGTVWTLFTLPFNFRAWFRPKQTKPILQGLDGIVQKGELLLVLGRPGSGCSTFLKTITGQMHSLELDSASILQYTGVVKINIGRVHDVNWSY
jgi:ATP-binding cassette subfamily G (WHITE) protein 2 (PDR)